MPSSRTRRLLAGVALVVVAACAVVGAAVTAARSPGATASEVRRPNIVFVLTDDLSRNLVQYMPHVIGLERVGTTFGNYTVTDSLCCPSRSSLFTGRFPHDTRIFTNSGKGGGFYVFHSRGEESSTFATDLQSAGYRTAMMGKYLNGYQPNDPLGGAGPYVPPGWNEWDVTGNGYGEYNYTINHNGHLQQHGSKPSDYLTDVLSHKASHFVTSSAAAHTPFMIEVATFAPHAPYVPAPSDAKSFPGLRAPRGPAYDTIPTHAPTWLADREPLTTQERHRIDLAFRKRVQAVQSVDRMIGALESSLARAGVARNTLIMFSSDNGYHMGQYRLTPGKMTAFDTDISVPLVMAGPGIPHKVAYRPAENIDLRPTFDELAGTPVPNEVDGHSLVPLLSGAPRDWRTAALIEHHGPDTDPSDPDHPGRNSGNPPTYKALRTTTYTYVEYVNGEREYYDRARDPYELHNIVGSLTAARLATLHHALGALHACHGQWACWQAAHPVG